MVMAPISVMLIFRRRKRGWSLSRSADPSLGRSFSKPLFDCPDDEVLSHSGVFRPVITDGLSLGGNIWSLRGSVGWRILQTNFSFSADGVSGGGVLDI